MAPPVPQRPTGDSHGCDPRAQVRRWCHWSAERRLHRGEEALMSLSRMASISERENREIEAANASGNTPVVFIHGLWLLPSSWASWADFFKQARYAPLT